MSFSTKISLNRNKTPEIFYRIPGLFVKTGSKFSLPNMPDLTGKKTKEDSCMQRIKFSNGDKYAILSNNAELLFCEELPSRSPYAYLAMADCWYDAPPVVFFSSTAPDDLLPPEKKIILDKCCDYWDVFRKVQEDNAGLIIKELEPQENAPYDPAWVEQQG